MSQRTSEVPTVGMPAPEINLDTTGGTKATLAAYRGHKNVLLAFFPLAFTSTCSAELCAFNDDYAAFELKNVVVIPISVDAVPSLKEYKAKMRIGVDLASDFKREASRAYGVLMESTFFANRAYFLIDTDGIVRWAHVEGTPSTRRENSEILEQIEKL